jgi:hypothetical protein
MKYESLNLHNNNHCTSVDLVINVRPMRIKNDISPKLEAENCTTSFVLVVFIQIAKIVGPTFNLLCSECTSLIRAKHPEDFKLINHFNCFFLPIILEEEAVSESFVRL